MKQQDKELLLKDLCSRLPYGVKVQTTYINQKTKERSDIGIDTLSTVEISMLIEGYEEHKPYLFPLSSMTKEQKEVYCQLQQKVIYNSKGFVTEDVMEYVNWCYKNHIDINDLIPIGLAIDATGLSIY